MSRIETVNPQRERWLQVGRRAVWRVAGGLLVLWAVATLTFFALRLMPGDPVLAILGGPSGNPSPETIAEATREYGLDKPLAVQYALYLGRLVQGDLGVSYSQHLPVTRVLAEQSWATLQLTFTSLVLAWLLVLLLTVLTAGRQRWVAKVASFAETVSAAVPHFWLGLVLLAVFAFGLRWFPPAGSDGWRTLVLPSVALAVPLAGFIAQVTRESLELTLEQPFVLTARTRGLSETAVRFKHALRHAVLPGISLSGWAIGALISGAVVVEVIFSRKGLGRQLYQAVQAQDLPLTIGISLTVAAVYVLANILVDLLHLWVDPRQQGKTA
ncbi:MULTISPECIES: ABC transporter permease [Pseudomonas]|jgi:peptide/nickel transport system permease protein|uniref:ABC transporter permease subunit n=2 Tax=Pseudomonas helleri TaxID=1608996 RepID=A0A0J6L575_9PSED|nr:MULTISPECIES: ABC transporter permease [Pseudomonas]KMN09641.1 ABC transporter permease [Pseudomonas helleri]MQT37614.1 ABC transporter permease subunit [Pseudomonas helleri]MQT60417.1 ABC transporter permease subunit [Pseudomonas sp. FSL R10-0399]MQT96991.1 ABC transporter permease subunit [Pseudomonas helleri]MQU09073.1 ABC transporter permease subunit [Pseudomonas helleri]